ncbi:hypothetical protein [Pseudomonas aeruginosa]|uniref:hypothetical protein n=1 Tax=Pseudomonas aeruginosa TaxID=287 RepID=UPI00044EFEFB|nr:hypothetical protein [Pseudomonas aeruginosa]ALZ15047.1 hypothetical protein HV98_21235 [Pseudomonas aeruginosa]EZN54530.1 hypothetical protein AJ73_02473 [Pseudomonas aeruginosa BWH033]MBG4054075.1 hypothetical protein [Pseudomonas aeruginosa]MBG5199515.1 hypothetical protein [Pseudomonas aeruginosa]MBG6778332.1 hypothetical protein [Pseudomonas aeruginosa]
MSEVKRFDHVNHAHVDDCEHIENPEGAWVKASDYDALVAKLAMAEDAAAKGDAARQQCGGMEMEIQELRENAAKLAAFAQEIISGALEGGSFDGADIQESAERHGLIAKQVMNEPCRGPEEYCACAWSTSFPTECYRITAELRALLNQDKENGNG